MYSQLTVGSRSFVVGNLAYYQTWIDNPQNQTIIAAAVGGGAGLILLVVIAVIVFVCLRRRKRRRNRQRQPTGNNIYSRPGRYFTCC